MKSRLTGKDSDAGKDWGQEEKGMTEDEMVGWHHLLNRHEFEQSAGDVEDGGASTNSETRLSVQDGEAPCAAVHGSQTVRHD